MPKFLVPFAVFLSVLSLVITIGINTTAQNKVETPPRVKVVMYEDQDNVCYIPMTNHGISCLPRVRPMVSSSSSSSEGIKRGTSNAHLNGNFPNNNIPNLNSSALDSSSSTQNSSSESSI